jgi:protein tyrosine/serine phosphatase
MRLAVGSTVAAVLFGATLHPFALAVERPPAWAQPVAGVNNLHKVAGGLYRCAQPDAAGMAALEKLGVRTVVNLRDHHDDLDAAKGTRLRLLRIEMSADNIETERIARVLALLREKEHGPFAVHCHHGADRTGVVCAMFRMIEQRWPRNEAIREMREGGYGFHPLWVNIVRYLEKVDVEQVRRRVDELAQSPSFSRARKSPLQTATTP